MARSDTADIAVRGPVNGLGEDDKDGSYYKIIVLPNHSERREYRITGEQLSELSDECQRLELEASQ